jgi:lysozyme
MRKLILTPVVILAFALLLPIGPAKSDPAPSASPSPAPTAKSGQPVVKVTVKPEVVITSQTYQLSGTVKRLPSASPSATASGSASPSPTAVPVRIQQKNSGKWSTIATAKLSRTGRWKLSLVAPATMNFLILRAAYEKSYSAEFGIRVAVLPNINVAGPGGRIAGVDISRWQHSILPIDFKQMAKSGIAFVFLKGSDGNKDDDVLSRPLAINDSSAVKAAGMYVGYYHFARVPKSNTSSVVVASAKEQANQALARLAELGGYGGTTLPYVLDIESAPKIATDATVTLWTRTWLDAMYAATGRRSIVYSYRYFLASKILSDSATQDYLRQSPLWLAHPGNPANPKLVPGRFDKGAGCYINAWTLADCTTTWSFWQYTSRGDRELYGIPWSPQRGSACPKSVKYCSTFVGQARKHLDMNVFNGSITDLMELAQGTWTQVAKPPVGPVPSPSSNPVPTP